MSTPPTDVKQWDEAVLWFLARVPMTKDQWLKLSARARRRAFTVAGVAKVDVLHDVFKGIDRAVAKGTSLEKLRKSVGEKLRSAWQGSVKNPAWRLETIYRTNVQHAYSAGRWAQMTDPVVLKHRPFGMFDAILDNRVTERCEELDGTILPWEEWEKRGLVPPLHFGCRSGLRSLRKSQAEKKPGWGKAPPAVAAQDGFGLPPQASEWEPDLEKYPPELRNHVKSRLAGADALEPMAAPEGARFSDSGLDESKSHQWRSIGPHVPPAQAEPNSNVVPTGPSIGDALRKGKRTKEEEFDTAVDAINAVHGVGKLERIPVAEQRMKGIGGKFEHVRAGRAIRIVINPDERCPAWDLIHEVAHMLDTKAMGQIAGYASSDKSSVLAATMEAIRGSACVKRLERLRTRKAIRFKIANGKTAQLQIDPALLEESLHPKELFARAYVQYIAIRSGNKRLLQELALLQNAYVGVEWPEQWDADDFRPIATAFDAVLEALGWTTKTTPT